MTIPMAFTANAWLYYKRSKPKTSVTETVYKNNRHFHYKLTVLVNTRADLTKGTFSDLQDLKTGKKGMMKILTYLTKQILIF